MGRLAKESLAGLLLLATKFSKLFYVGSAKLFPLIIKFLKMVAAGQLALVAVSFGSYAVFFTWQFAVLMTVSLLIHELGHVWAMRLAGMQVRGVYFVPLIGAVTVSQEAFPNRFWRGTVALMGPAWGFGLGALTAGYGLWSGDTIFMVAACYMALLNLLNLLPLEPLDGGHLYQSVFDKTNGWLGLIISSATLAVVAWHGQWIFVLFALGPFMNSLETIGVKKVIMTILSLPIVGFFMVYVIPDFCLGVAIVMMVLMGVLVLWQFFHEREAKQFFLEEDVAKMKEWEAELQRREEEWRTVKRPAWARQLRTHLTSWLGLDAGASFRDLRTALAALREDPAWREELAWFAGLRRRYREVHRDWTYHLRSFALGVTEILLSWIWPASTRANDVSDYRIGKEREYLERLDDLAQKFNRGSTRLLKLLEERTGQRMGWKNRVSTRNGFLEAALRTDIKRLRDFSYGPCDQGWDLPGFFADKDRGPAAVALLLLLAEPESEHVFRVSYEELLGDAARQDDFLRELPLSTFQSFALIAAYLFLLAGLLLLLERTAVVPGADAALGFFKEF